MSVSFSGFNENTATFKSNEEIAGGTPVKMSGTETVAAAASGEAFCGIAVDGDGEYASVQLSGAVRSKYSGTAPAAGYSKLVSDGEGVTASESGREYLVVAVDEAAETVTFII
ncbi:MAG: hypothetical protein IJE48_10345 [Clostridia bacterium]|nr:hypothetical protein [Clostridia bacterium]